MEHLDLEKIEQYLDGRLEPSEQELIEERMSKDSAFAEEVALHQLTMQGIEQFGLNEIKKDIGRLDKALANEGFFLAAEDMDSYSEGNLNAEQKNLMEKRLADDAAFKADFDLHQLTKEGIEKNGEEAEFADLFSKIDQDLEEEGFFEELSSAEKTIGKAEKKKEAKVIRFSLRKLAVAASVALAIFSAWWIFQPAPSSQTIYANHFTPFSDQLSVELEEMGFVKKPYYDLLEDGIEAYNIAKATNPSSANDYNNAKDHFTEYRNIAPTDDEFYPMASLYLAISHLALNETSEAIPLLTTIAQQSFPQQADAQWYLALAYLKNKETEKAIPLLTALKQSSYGEQARAILRQLTISN